MSGPGYDGYPDGGEFDANSGFGNFGPGNPVEKFAGNNFPTGYIYVPPTPQQSEPKAEYIPGVKDPLGRPLNVQGDQVLHYLQRGIDQFGVPINQYIKGDPSPGQKAIMDAYRSEQAVRAREEAAKKLAKKYPRMSDAELAAKVAARAREQEKRRPPAAAPVKRPEGASVVDIDNDVDADLLRKGLPLESVLGPAREAIVSGAARRLLESEVAREDRLSSHLKPVHGAEAALRAAGEIAEADELEARRQDAPAAQPHSPMHDVRPPNSSRRARGVPGFYE
jgi:hypothetical protein